MRRIVPALAAVAMLAAWTGPAHAAQVRIDGFRFACKTPDGKTLKPRFGDIPSWTYRLPEQRESCLNAIERHIHGCSENTDFGGYRDRDKRYPGCLPIFEEQAKACAAHFRDERAKCDAGGDAAETPAPEADTQGQDAAETPAPEADTQGQDAAETPAPEADPVAALIPKCEGVAKGTSCWKRISGGRECWIWDPNGPEDTLTWSGNCSDNVGNGTGTIVSSSGDEGGGSLVRGKLHGRWIVRYASGSCQVHEFSDGQHVKQLDRC